MAAVLERKYSLSAFRYDFHRGAGLPRSSAQEALKVPENVINTALRAANLVGDGLYGVDLKEIGGKCYVIEINDNPNIDCGYEDAVLKMGLYSTVMQVFRDRIEKKKQRVMT